MLNKATKKNSLLISSGKAELLSGEFAETSFPKNGFDKVAAFNVNTFRHNSKTDFIQVAECRKTDGRFYLFYQFPQEPDSRTIEVIKQISINNSFLVDEVIIGKVKPVSAWC